MRELEFFPKFIFRDPNLNDIRYRNGAAMITDTEGKLKELLQEDEKKGITINCMETEYMFLAIGIAQDVNYQPGDVKINEVEKFNNDRKCYTGIQKQQRYLSEAKNAI